MVRVIDFLDARQIRNIDRELSGSITCCVHEVVKLFLKIEYQMAERGLILRRDFHRRRFPLGAVGIPEMYGRALWVEADSHGLDRYRVALGDGLVARRDFQFNGVHIGRLENTSQQLCAPNWKEQ